MSFEIWFSLDENNKTILDRLDDKAKAIIVGYNDYPSSSKLQTSPAPSMAILPPFVKQPFGQPRGKTQAIVHDISAYDILLAYMHFLKMTTRF
jgi:hypothetical protein